MNYDTANIDRLFNMKKQKEEYQLIISPDQLVEYSSF